MSEIVVDDIKCDKCPLWQTSIKGNTRRSGVYGRGNGKLGLWIYGDGLKGDDCELGFPLAGDSGTILSSILKSINFCEDDLWITSSVRCFIPNNKSPSAKDIKNCMGVHSKLDVPPTAPKLILCMGNVALKAILNKQKIKENRGVIFDCPEFNCKAMATYNPAAILKNKKTNVYDTIKADLLKAKEFCMSDTPSTKTIRHSILINSEEDYLYWMGVLRNPQVKERVCDIETTGLDFWKDKIISISFTTEIEGEIYSIAFLTQEKSGWWFADLDNTKIKASLQEVLAYPTDFHNGLFDVKFFWQKRINVCFGIDTMDQHLMIDENSPHNLQYCVSIYNKEEDGYKQEIATLLGDDGHHSDLAPLTLLDYNNEDTYNTYLLKKKFTPLVKKEGMEDFFNKLAMPLKRSLTKISYRGIMMDRQGIITTSERYRAKILTRREELYDKAHKKFDYSGTSKDIKIVLFKDLGLPVVKYTGKSKQPSSDKYALEELARISEVPAIILELREYEYALRMYLDGNDLNPKGIKPESGMLCRLDKNDRIHGNFLSGGTISGRPSCTKPNLLNIPKKADIKNLFIAPNGWKLIEKDFSQAELVLLAHLSGDEQFIHDVMSDDFHLATAKSLMKVQDVSDIIRRAAKAINFLKSYGGGAEKLGNTLRLQEEKLAYDELKNDMKYYDKICLNQMSWYHQRSNKPCPIKYRSVNKSRRHCYVCEAEIWLKKWDTTYSKVPIYKEEQKIKWKENNYILGLWGRKKRFPPVFNREQESYCDRISVNFMCQNGVSEKINESIVDIDYLLDQIFPWTPDTMYNIPGIVLSVYDSIICEAPNELVPEISQLMNEIMLLPIPKLNISLKCDTTITQRWGEKMAKEPEPEDLLEIMGAISDDYEAGTYV